MIKKENMTNNRGIALVVIILIMVGVIIVGYLGFRWKISSECSKSMGPDRPKEITKKCGQLLSMERSIKNFFGLKQKVNVTNSNKSEKPSSDPTASWQTYRNEEYGFEVKYPKEWSLFKESDNQITWEENNDKSTAFRIEILDNSNNLSLENFAKEYYKNLEYQIIKQGVQTVDLYGIETKVNLPAAPTDVIDILFQKNGKVFVLETITINENTLNQILSTFKFTPQ